MWLDYSGRIYNDKQNKNSFLLEPVFSRYKDVLDKLGNYLKHNYTAGFPAFSGKNCCRILSVTHFSNDKFVF